MSYGWTKETKTDVPSTSFLPAGIHENVRVEDIHFEVEEKSQLECLCITLVNASGQKHTERVFDPARSQFDPDREVKRGMVFLGNLTRSITGNSEYAIEEVETFAELCRKISADMSNFLPKASLRVKLIIDKKGFSKLSRNVPVFEPMTIPSSESKIRIRTEHPYNETIEAPRPSEHIEVPVGAEAESEDVF